VGVKRSERLRGKKSSFFFVGFLKVVEGERERKRGKRGRGKREGEKERKREREREDSNVFGEIR
jgi:hypothetical protein